MHIRTIGMAAILCAAVTTGVAYAKLPAPTPEQQQAAAAKKEQAAAQAEQEKQQLGASMERIAARWRAHAAANGWKAHPPTPASAGASATPIRSEKLGTAAPSTDVKQPEKQGPPDKIK